MDIEAVFINLLNDLEFIAHDDVPKDKPDEFVTVELVSDGAMSTWGGSLGETPQLAIQCWSTTRTKACELSLKVGKAIKEFCEASPDFSLDSYNRYNFPGEKGEPRYQILVSISTI